MRLWKANCDGNVLETVIFKDSVAKAQMLFGPQVLSNKDSDSKPISLASSLTSLNSEFTGNLNFLQLYRLGDSQFVTFCRSHLFVIDLINADISYHYCFPDPIICISVCPSNSEIFVLCERHYLARLGEWLDNSISGETLVKSQETSRSSSPLFGKLISAKNSVISKVSKSSASDKIETERYWNVIKKF